MAGVRLFRDASAVGSSGVTKVTPGSDRFTVLTEITENGATAFSACKINLQAAVGGRAKVEAFAKTGIHATTGLAIGSTAEQISWGAFGYRINDVNYVVGADASQALPTAHTIALSKYGVINVYVNAAGTMSTRVPGNSQTAAQTYTLDAAGAALAIAASKAMITPEGLVYIGRILIKNDGTLWTAGTDDLTDGSDVATAQFFAAIPLFVNIAEHTFTLDELTDTRAVFYVNDKYATYVRLYIETLTGTVLVNSILEASEGR